MTQNKDIFKTVGNNFNYSLFPALEAGTYVGVTVEAISLWLIAHTKLNIRNTQYNAPLYFKMHAMGDQINARS